MHLARFSTQLVSSVLSLMRKLVVNKILYVLLCIVFNDIIATVSTLTQIFTNEEA